VEFPAQRIELKEKQKEWMSSEEFKEKSISNKPTKNTNSKHLAEVRKNVLNTLYPIELIKDNNTRIVSKNSSNNIEVKNIENIQKINFNIHLDKNQYEIN
jgi:hypothetical protein